MSTVRDLLAKKGTQVAAITPDSTVLQAADLMNQQRIGALCVVDGAKLLGVFTERDILNRVVSAQRDPAATKVSEVMTTPVTTCGPNGKVSDCAAVMSHQRIRHLPVVEDDRLVGLISTGDVMAMQAAKQQEHIEDLYQYLHGRT
jgi:CBS domain-containing protein